jgi:hypothetical protein
VSTVPGRADRTGSAVPITETWPVAPSSGRHGYGWLLFAGIVLTIAGALNVIYGIAGISNSSFYSGHGHYIFSNVKTWGWITLVLGLLQLIASISLFRGGLYGRLFGILAAGVSAVGALLSIAGSPFLSLALFLLSILVLYGIATFQAGD